MASNHQSGHARRSSHQSGFTLVEIMVGMAIGLLASLAIVQVFSTFEAQKRSTMGSSDAQTNGSIALYTIERDVQMAGFGLPVFDTINPPLKCDPSPTVAATTPATIDIFPLSIVDGGTAPGASDTIQVRYGDTPLGGIAIQIVNPNTPTASPGIAVLNNGACPTILAPSPPGVALITNGTACGATTYTLPANTTNIILASAPAALSAGAYIACLGAWTQLSYAVNSVNGLPQLGMQASNVAAPAVPIVPDIVNIQAQYGVSAIATSNVITQWVDATGTWGPGIAVDDRNQIKAIRVAVVARNGTMDRNNVLTSACSSTTAAAPTGLCAWEGTAASPAPVIDLSSDPNWAHYRYRVFETIIPLRNMIWSKNTL
jgi:type IV pilus assembly protein PilW